MAQGNGSVSSINCGIKITLTASAPISNGKVCIPQCLRANQPGYNNDAGIPETCNNTITVTATVENVGYPGNVANVPFTWLINGSGSGSGNGGIEQVGTATPLTQNPFITPTVYTTQVVIKSRASNWNWTPGSVSLSFQAPPVPIYCPGNPNPVSTCPGCSGVSPTLVVYKDGTYPPVEGTEEVIMGPKCVKIGDIVSYTVYPRYTWVPTAFPDSYLWNVNETNTNQTFPFGLTWLQGLKVLYWSGDRSSVTVLVEQDFTGGEIQINAGTANNCNNEKYKLTLGLIPTKFKLVATSINGVGQSPPVSAICLPMDENVYTFDLEIVSDELLPNGQPRPLGNLTFTWEALANNAFTKIDDGSDNKKATYRSEIPEGCPRGSAGSINVRTTTNCPAPNTPYLASIPVNRSFTDQQITTVPNQSPICIDDLGNRYDFFVNNLSCGASVSWTPPGEGWYAHNPMATPPTNGSVWSGHVAIPPLINGNPMVVKASDACGNTIVSQPIVVSWDNLEVELKFLLGTGQRPCPELRAHLVNLPDGCCSDNFEFIWTHSRGDQGFCNKQNPSGCGQNWIALWETGLVTLTVKSCKENPCHRCVRSERYTFRIPNTEEVRRWLDNCRRESECPKPDRQCRPWDPGTNPDSEKNEKEMFQRPEPKSGFNLVPNPAQNEFSIGLTEEVEQGSYEVMDSYGKVISSGKIKGTKVKIKTKDFARGRYSVKVITEKSVWTENLILE